MANSSTKHSCSKGNNSLPPTKRFDFTMVDDNFDELQCGFAPKETNADTKKCVKLFKDWASARNNHSSSTIKMVLNDILLTDTTLQLLEVVIHHGVIKPLGRWRLFPLLRERLEDLAILHRVKARYRLQVCNPQTAHATIQTTRAFSWWLFLVNHLLHAFSGILYTHTHTTHTHTLQWHTSTPKYLQIQTEMSNHTPQTHNTHH